MRRSSDGRNWGETGIDEMTKKYKDVGITDHSMVWNTDLSETLVLENLVNQAEHEMYYGISWDPCSRGLPGE